MLNNILSFIKTYLIKRVEEKMMTESKVVYTIDITVKSKDDKDKKSLISLIRQKIKRAVIDTSADVKITKIKIQESE